MVLAYGIALNINWMNPSWAGFAVAMVSLATAGQSINKGLLRIAGTIPGCVMALVILSIAPQDRWTFVILTSIWIFVTTYLMIVDKNRSYMWNVAGFVCLIILLSGPSSSANAFGHAIARSMETVMGVVVYTLITVFIWPRTNAGAIRKSGAELLATQLRLLQAGRQLMNGQDPGENHENIYSVEVQKLYQLNQAILAESAESLDQRDSRPIWDRFALLAKDLTEAIGRWRAGLLQLSEADVYTALSALPAFLDEMENRLEKMQGMLAGDSDAIEVQQLSLTVDAAHLKRMSIFDQAASAATKKDLESIESLTRLMLSCVHELNTGAAERAEAEKSNAHHVKRNGFSLPVLDVDHLKGAAFAALAVFVGFLVWVLVNPPGHAGWFELSGVVAMAMAAHQQLRPIMLIKSVGLASVLCLGVYVFIMPGLSSFVGLGSLLFLLVFITCYFFTGIGRLAGMIAIINEIAISNPQSYNFAAMANSLVFMILGFSFLIGMSYLLRASRPEKALLNLTRRYFRSVEYLLQIPGSARFSKPAWLQRWKHYFHRYEIRTIPQKIAAWGMAIDHKLFPANSKEQVQALVSSLEVLSIRLEILLQACESKRSHELIGMTNTEIEPWLTKMENTSGSWSKRSEMVAGSVKALQIYLSESLDTLETQISTILGQAESSSMDAGDGEIYFRLLGGLRGLSEASVAYAGVAGGIDWDQWCEERFS